MLAGIGALERHQLLVHLLDVREGLQQGVQQRARARELLRLAQVRDARPPENAHVARVGLQVPREQAKGRRLARAVRPHEGQAVSWADEQGRPGEDLVARVPEADVSELCEGHAKERA